MTAPSWCSACTKVKSPLVDLGDGRYLCRLCIELARRASDPGDCCAGCGVPTRALYESTAGDRRCNACAHQLPTRLTEVPHD